MTPERVHLECQTCGRELGPPLTPAQRHVVALNPERFIVYCSQRCRAADPARLR